MTNPRHHIGSVITRAWTDDAFKARFLADPLAVLKAEGIEVPSGPALRFMENSDTLAHLILPAKPAEPAPGCVREDALSAGWKSLPHDVTSCVVESNCVAVNRGTERP